MAQSTITPARPTEKFAKSVGGSLKSLVGGKGRKYFILEHVTASEKHRAGETTEFIGDYVEMGRGSQYAVNFGEDCQTVSRPHAAIVRTEEGWVLKQLSVKNPTLVNKNPVNGQVTLRNGYEIQLSYEGPKLLFLVPANNSVGTMGMTARMKAVVNEAVRPYRKTIATTLVVFLAIIGGLVYYLNQQRNEYKNLITGMEKTNKAERDSILAKNSANQAQLEARISKLIKERMTPPSGGSTGGGMSTPGSSVASSSLKGLYSNVYYIRTDKVTAEINGQTIESEYALSGSGFLLSDGSFVTARHVVEPWYFLNSHSSETERALNVAASNGGKITHHFTAYSPSGGKISFSSTDFTVDRSQDEVNKTTDEQGNQLLITLASNNLVNGRDWAVCKTDGKSGLAFNVEMSRSLPAATKLYVLGYPFGMGVNSASDILPIYSECQVSRDGLDNGKIDISGRSFDTGNSGGPVFAMTGNNYYVVGIVSAENGAQGLIVPLASIH